MLPYSSESRKEYYRKNIYPFVYKLVDNYIDSRGYDQEISIDHINENDVSKLASMLLSEDPSILFDIIHEKDLYSFLIIAMRTEDSEDKINWAEKTIDNVVNHFRANIQLILEDVYNDQVSELKESRAENLKTEDDILRRINNG